MKLLSIAVPSYNSQDYLDRCIATLLPGGDEVEILIVDDGSKDRTAEIADEYEKKYPGIVRAIHQPNKGHGGAVNTGLAAATGLYFRVVDSDDWLDFDAYAIALATLRKLHAEHNDVDLFLSNYVYEKEGKKHKRVIHYESVLPEDRVFTWDDVGHFKLGQYLLMHTMIYRTELLRSTDCSCRSTASMWTISSAMCRCSMCGSCITRISISIAIISAATTSRSTRAS